MIGIRECYITFPDKLNYASIAKKMSWASKRVTSRAEDIAYCLLGIFDVSMPLLYGKGGNKAFMRFQLEIIKRSDDESIFAWASDQYFAGMLASSPSYFVASEDVRKYLRGVEQRPPYATTNKGLEFHIPDPRLPGGEVALHCSRTISEEDVAVTITLYKHNDTW